MPRYPSTFVASSPSLLKAAEELFSKLAGKHRLIDYEVCAELGPYEDRTLVWMGDGLMRGIRVTAAFSKRARRVQAAVAVQASKGPKWHTRKIENGIDGSGLASAIDRAYREVSAVNLSDLRHGGQSSGA